MKKNLFIILTILILSLFAISCSAEMWDAFASGYQAGGDGYGTLIAQVYADSENECINYCEDQGADYYTYAYDTDLCSCWVE